MHHKYHVPEVIHLVIAVAAVIENYRIYREVKLVLSNDQISLIFIFLIMTYLLCIQLWHGEER